MRGLIKVKNTFRGWFHAWARCELLMGCQIFLGWGIATGVFVIVGVACGALEKNMACLMGGGVYDDGSGIFANAKKVFVIERWGVSPLRSIREVFK